MYAEVENVLLATVLFMTLTTPQHQDGTVMSTRLVVMVLAVNVLPDTTVLAVCFVRNSRKGRKIDKKFSQL